MSSGSDRFNGRMFAVVSWGSAATHWLSAVFNRHPDIFAWHHARSVRSRHLRGLDPVEYLRLIQGQSRGMKLAGDVHGISLEELDAVRSAWGDSIRFASVVRHPIQRGISSMRFWSRGPRPVKSGWYAGERVRAVRSRLNSSQAVYFARAMTLADNIVRESAAGPVFRMEDLTSDVSHVWKLIEHLSAGEITRDGRLDEFIMVKEKLAVHGSSTQSREPYVEEPWQHELYERIVSDEGKRLYQALGYTIRPPAGPPEFPPAGPLPPDTPNAGSMPLLTRFKWAAKFLLGRLPADGRFP